MTNILLTIIGILLAAAAALMGLFYGGDAFSTGRSKSDVAALSGAGTTMASSALMYENEKNRAPSSVEDLVPEFMPDVPALRGIGVPQESLRKASLAGGIW